MGFVLSGFLIGAPLWLGACAAVAMQPPMRSSRRQSATSEASLKGRTVGGQSAPTSLAGV